MKKLAAYITLVLTATFVLSPLVANPFSGFRADQLPIPQVEPPVQPAGYAFAIWGLIYTWLAVSALYGVVKRPEAADWHRARWPLIVSLAVGTPWLAIANNSAVWASITIFIMAAGAIVALLRTPERDIWLFRVPVGIYAGWLTAASFVSLGSTAAGYGLITDQTGWAYLGIAGALLVAAPVQWFSKAPSYGLTVVWALVAIIVANQLDLWTVSAMAAVGIAIMLALVAMRRPSGLSASS
ncbi:hypothetical protein [Yoonia litorea]|uniref:TspO and MBR related proteins n=1 Tax=Yoonia litorea TaxID=1123755 RepID=A0A1I6LV77_9RHOB|nr:hypothetical protein [Yoonia litorea]SFS07345.1 hypothetical protein SAMN05444714_0926 [Yoonia litorea]